MAGPLLATKLYVPPPTKNLVERPCLIEKLNNCLDPGCRLALISAPAGFGKTTLASRWISELKLSPAYPSHFISWLTIEETDNNPVVFWSYIIASLQSHCDKLGIQTIELFEAAPKPNLEESLILPGLWYLILGATLLPAVRRYYPRKDG